MEVPHYTLGDDITVRAGGAGSTGDISPDWRAAAGRRPSDSPDSHMEYLFQKIMQLSELWDEVAKLKSEGGRRRESEGAEGPSEGHGKTL